MTPARTSARGGSRAGELQKSRAERAVARPPGAFSVPSLFPRTTAAGFFTAALLVAAALARPGAARAADLFLDDEPEVYAALDKLNASGYLPGFLANTRPCSMQAVRTAAEAASLAAAPEGFDGELLRWLAWYTREKEMGRVTAGLSRADARALPPNAQGIPRPKGWAASAALSLREERTPYLSGQFRAASFYGEGGDGGNRLLDASVEGGTRYFSVQAGKLSSWYGPGRRGSLILTNNAAAYPGVRIRNPEPIPLTGRLGFLGSLQYDFFAARMEKKERFSHSAFVGTRLAARPRPWLEVGLSRVLHYGGEGRSNGLSEFFTAYGGNNDPSDRSNTIAGYDITLTLPFRLQPVQLYWDRAGEGDNRFLGTELPWPSQWGNLFGLHLPRILGERRAALRAEYADNYSGYAKTADWYSHGAYPHFYRGAVLGHPMGGGSRDWFIQARYFVAPAAFAELFWERILHDRGIQPSIGFPGERRTVWSAGFTGWLTKNWRGEARAFLEKTTSQGGVPGSRGTDFSASLTVAYQTTSLAVGNR